MKQIENNFAVSGFVGKDAEIRQFANASVARFSLAISRQEKNGEETKRISAFINVEAWRNNANTDSLSQITKSTLLTVEGYFKPEEWTDKDGVKHNRIILVANKFYPTPDKEDAPAEPEKKTKKRQEIVPAHSINKAASVAFVFARICPLISITQPVSCFSCFGRHLSGTAIEHCSTLPRLFLKSHDTKKICQLVEDFVSSRLSKHFVDCRTYRINTLTTLP